MPPRDAFPGYDEPVKVTGDPEEVLRALLAEDAADGDGDAEAEEAEEREAEA